MKRDFSTEAIQAIIRSGITDLFVFKTFWLMIASIVITFIAWIFALGIFGCHVEYFPNGDFLKTNWCSWPVAVFGSMGTVVFVPWLLALFLLTQPKWRMCFLICQAVMGMGWFIFGFGGLLLKAYLRGL